MTDCPDPRVREWSRDLGRETSPNRHEPSGPGPMVRPIWAMCATPRHGDNRDTATEGDLISWCSRLTIPFSTSSARCSCSCGFVVWFWLLIRVFGDVFRRNDIGGWTKFFWSVFVIVIPLLGVLIYLIAQGQKIGERDMDAATAQKAEFDAYVPRRRATAGLATRSRRQKNCSTAARSARPSSTRSSRRPWHSSSRSLQTDHRLRLQGVGPLHRRLLLACETGAAIVTNDWHTGSA